MAWIVEKDFKDWDGQKVSKGTLGDRLVIRGGEKDGLRFYNLISGNRVIAVTAGRPPVVEAD